MNDDVQNTNRLFYVGPQIKRSGRMAGELMTAMLRGHGNIITISSDVDSLEFHERQRGFNEVIIGQDNNMQILANIIYQSRKDDEYNIKIMKSVLDNMAIIDGIYCTSGNNISSVISKILNGRPPSEQAIAYICHETSINSYANLQKNIIWACISQDPFTQGYYTVKYLFEFLMNGKKPPAERMYTKLDILMKENIEIGPDIIIPYQI
jgi:ABC-type sugar transport system substrate-binding protein